MGVTYIMKLRDILQIIIEALSGKTCDKCKHNVNGLCTYDKYSDCVDSIYPKGFEAKDEE